MTENKILIPEIIELEIVKGICSANCPMCSIGEVKKDSGIMTYEKFVEIIDSFGDNIKNIKKVILCGIGEALLDKGISKKIEYLIDKGVVNISIPTNASHLNSELSKKILDAGVGEVILAVDSLDKNTYEKIRKNLKFEIVIENIHKYIKMRDGGGYDSKIMIRMVTSHANSAEWNDYIKYWSQYLDFDKGDMLLHFPEHNWSEHDYPNAKIEKLQDQSGMKCSYVSDRFNIDLYGNLKLCCLDVNASFYNLGNVLQNDPIKLYNSKVFNSIREAMDKGAIHDIRACKKCNIPIKRSKRGFYVGE